MNERKCARLEKSEERGGSRFNFMVVALILLALGFAGYGYVPVAFRAYQYKDLMKQDVDRAAALGKPAEDLKKQLLADGKEYGVPPDAAITIQQHEGRMEARVQFVQPIEYPGYTYKYEFDNTVKSDALLSK